MTRQPPPQDRTIRCNYCGALLATTGPGGLRILRGQLEVLIDGARHATFVCYRPQCRRINVIDVNAAE
jgi:hypothetical protein